MLSLAIRLFIIFASTQTVLIGMDKDAVGFFERAVKFEWKNLNLFETDSNIFVIWNWAIFKVFGESMLIGQLFCLLAWSLSFYILHLSIRLLSINKNNDVFKIFLIYCFLPSSLMINSSFLREPYQLLFVNISFFSFLKITRSSLRFIYFSLLLFSFLVLFLLHVAFVVVPIGYLFIYIYNIYNAKAGFSWLRKLWLPFMFFLFYFLPVIPMVSSVIELDAVGAFSSSDSRAFYVDINDSFNPLYRLVQFFLEPFPWRGLLIIDFVSIMENTIRTLLIIAIVFRYLFHFQNNISSFFILYMFIEYFWSMFTYNWGTAIRHHLPQYGLLILAFLQARADRKNYFFQSRSEKHF